MQVCEVCYHHCTLYMSIPLLRGVLPSLYALHVYSTRLQMQKAKWRTGGDITCIFNDQPKPRNATGTKPPIIPRVGDPLVKINRPRLHHKIRYRYYKQRKAWFYYQLPFSLPFFLFFFFFSFFNDTHPRKRYENISTVHNKRSRTTRKGRFRVMQWPVLSTNQTSVSVRKP